MNRAAGIVQNLWNRVNPQWKRRAHVLWITRGAPCMTLALMTILPPHPPSAPALGSDPIFLGIWGSDPLTEVVARQQSSQPADVEKLVLQRAERAIASQQFVEALAILEPLASQPAESRPAASDAARTRAAELRALAFLELHRYEEAKELFVQLTKLKITDPRPHIGLARCEEMLGNLDAAAAALDRAFTIDNKNPFVLFPSGQIAARRHEDARAREFLTKAVATSPWDDAAPSAHYILSQIATRAGDTAEAARQKELYDKKFKWADRRTALEQKLKLKPEDAPARRALAALWVEAGNGRAAMELLSPLIRAFPKDARVRVEYAEAQAASGDVKGAFETTAAALRVDSSAIAPRRHLAQLYILIKKHSRALAELKQALDRDPAATVEPALADVARQLADAATAANETEIATEAARIARELGK